jgi:hypothetical protein
MGYCFDTGNYSFYCIPVQIKIQKHGSSCHGAYSKNADGLNKMLFVCTD